METEVSLLANKGVSPPPNAAPGPRSEHDTRQAAVGTTPQRQDCHVPGITFRAAHGAAARWTRRRPIPRQPLPLARNTEPAMTRHTRTINTGGHRPRSSRARPALGPLAAGANHERKPELFAHAHATLTDPQCQKRPTRGAGAQTGCDCGGAAAPRPALRVGPRMCGRRMGQTPRARSPRQCQSPSRRRLSANRSG